MNSDERILAPKTKTQGVLRIHQEYQRRHCERMALYDEMLERLTKLSRDLDDLDTRSGTGAPN